MSEPAQLQLKIDVDSDPISGSVSGAEGHVKPFTGWIELAVAIEAARQQDESLGTPGVPRGRRVVGRGPGARGVPRGSRVARGGSGARAALGGGFVVRMRPGGAAAAEGRL